MGRLDPMNKKLSVTVAGKSQRIANSMKIKLAVRVLFRIFFKGGQARQSLSWGGGVARTIVILQMLFH